MSKKLPPQNRGLNQAAMQAPSDEVERKHALNPRECILVEAPAGSGKTTLLAERFLALLAAVDDPGEIVAITFTNAAAAEMRHRILGELEKAERNSAGKAVEGESAGRLALAAYAHSAECEWKLLDQPARLRITTIDSFCRELALQQPLLSSFGGELNVDPRPEEMYREAARRTLMSLDAGDARLRQAIRDLLEWRDNNWNDLETELVQMLSNRDKWLQHFVVAQSLDDVELRLWLERSFEEAARKSLQCVSELLEGKNELLREAHRLARFGCEQSGGEFYQELAEMAEFPAFNPANRDSIAEYKAAMIALAEMLLTDKGSFRAAINAKNGFPASCKAEQSHMIQLKNQFQEIPKFDQVLQAVRELPPSRYDEEDWRIIRACFTVLRQAAGELKTVFAERGRMDFAEVAALAQGVLNAGMNATGEAAFAVSEGIKHILVDEFQDTNRVQHRLLGSIVREWPEREGRTVFVVGDPMQSIYLFRNADAELFIRSREQGLDVPGEDPLSFNALKLEANFRTQPLLVNRLNQVFEAISAVDDGSSFRFAHATPARAAMEPNSGDGLHLHMKFVLKAPSSRGQSEEKVLAQKERDEACEEQITEIVELCRSYGNEIEEARESKGKFRVAILGRKKSQLTSIATALREAGLPFRAIDLEPLSERPEVQDALALARALQNPEDRLSWLGILRAPWCGLELDALYQLVSADDPKLLHRPILDLIAERMHLLDADARERLERVLGAIEFARRTRAANPTAALGSWLESVWLRLGGAACVGAAERVNLDLLWKALDGLTAGEEDLLGTALETALSNLMAQPDPGTSSEYGIQLMTLHKSKGLEFEIVIVPELQATTGKNDPRMLSWLERRRVSDTENDEPTEFLVAPIQPKGKERSDCKKWVDEVIRDCERQEIRRIFYVAATRAREELHLFARPDIKQSKESGFEVSIPPESLLGIARAAFESEIAAEFIEWLKAREATREGNEALALAATGNVLEFKQNVAQADEEKRREPTVKVRLRRLPKAFAVAAQLKRASTGSDIPVTPELYHRREGGIESRLLGTAIHTLLEKLGKLGVQDTLQETQAALLAFRPRLVAEIRASGISNAEAERIVDEAFLVTLKAAVDPLGRWILDEQKNAASEVRWTGDLNGELRQVQIDRLFQAGKEPLSQAEEGEEPFWWIIDYKSGQGTERLTSEELPGQREFYAPQIETYARVLKELRGDKVSICGGIYYPRPRLLDWWKMEV